jgi:serine protease Do
MPLTGIEGAITSVVERVTPSVVTISTVEMRRARGYGVFPAQGMGSGVVVGAPGHIVTNYHVVRNARSAEVVLPDGRRLQAEFLGGDPGYDLAVLRVAADLPPPPLADSESLKVGQLAIAIGSPFGHVLNGPSVTVGVVSAVRRRLATERGVVDDLIQTDAPINPGNSGGPLLNTKGEVIGINTAIIPYAQGIGFAVPAHIVKDAVDQLLRYGRIIRPWVGVAGVTAATPLARRLGAPDDPGVVVVEVEPGSPAEAAGVMPGDLLVKADGRDLRQVEDLQAAVRRRHPGDVLKATVRRPEGERTLSIRVAERRSESE